MNRFLTFATFTQDSLAALTQRPSNHADAVARVFEKHGGKLIDFYWTYGEADVVFLYEAPSNEVVLAALFTLYGRGAIENHRTTVLVSNDDAMAAMRLAGSVDTGYRTPRQEWQGWVDEGGEGG